MLKKKFFAKALAFAMATGLLATTAPVGAAAPVVQVMADAGDVTPVTDGVTVEGADSATTTYTFARTAEKTVTVTSVKSEGAAAAVSAYYAVVAAGAAAPTPSTETAWEELGETITIEDALKDGAVDVYVSSSATSGIGVKVAVPAYTAGGGNQGGGTTSGKLTCEVKYDTYSLEVRGAKYAFVDVLKKGKENTYKLSTTYAYTIANTEEGINIDLSFLKASAENYIRVYTIGEDPEKAEVKTIAKQPDKSVIKYVAGKTTQEASFTLKKGKGTAADFTSDQLSSYVYRTMSGSTEEKALKDLDLAMATVAGTTIIVREKATTTAPAGAEVKVKIAANPKAPKVAVDYVKETVSLPKDSYYRIITSTVDADDKWVNLKDGGKKSPATLAEDYGKVVSGVTKADAETGYTLVVYTQKAEKAASNPAYVTIAGQPKVNEATATADGKGMVVTVEGDTATGDAAKTLTMTTDGEGKTAKAIFTAKNADFIITVGSEKPKTVKAGKSVNIKQTESAQTVKVQLAGAKPVTKGTVTPGSFPSANDATVTIPAVKAAESTETGNKAKLTAQVDSSSPATIPAEGGDDTEVKIVVTATKVDGTTATLTDAAYTVTAPEGAVADKVLFSEAEGKKNILLIKEGATAGSYTVKVTATIEDKSYDATVTVEVKAAAENEGEGGEG
ncbi:MAG: hypothetical protein K2N94_01515 [Lachnospiraceae bacterium]|nr:hypothetical protein [Lachnospiraceae bacterium]